MGTKSRKCMKFFFFPSVAGWLGYTFLSGQFSTEYETYVCNKNKVYQEKKLYSLPMEKHPQPARGKINTHSLYFS